LVPSTTILAVRESVAVGLQKWIERKALTRIEGVNFPEVFNTAKIL
jgi:hypothetical protein